MTADKPSPLVPKLRFPEFRKAPPWSVKPMGSLFHERQETGFPELPLLSVTDRDGVIAQEETNRKITTKMNKAKYLRVVPGDIVYNTMRMWEGRSARVSMEGVVSPAYTVCRPDVETNSYFFAYYFKTRSLIEQFRKYSQGLVKDTLNLKYRVFSLISVGFPPPDEQQKIADCLGSLDDLIAAEGRKLEALREHKQGLMQQLLPQPGHTLPRLRFPEFEDAPEWELRELGPMTSKIGSGVTPRGGDKNYRFSGRPFVRSQNVGWGELILDSVAYIDEDTHASFAATEVEEGDVLLNISGASIGRSAVADARIVGGNVNQHVCIIRGLNEHVEAWFISQYLISKHGQDQIDRCQAGGNRQGLNFGQIRSFLIPQPREVAEQERIAGCLRSADIILANQAQRIGTLKRQKQGLLQQLFPALEG